MAYQMNYNFRKDHFHIKHNPAEGIMGKLSTGEVDYRELSMLQQAIFDGANYSIISTDVDGTIRSFNNAASRMLGYKPEELIGQHTPAVFHDPDEVSTRAKQLTEELGEEIKPGFEVFVAKARRGIAEELEWTYIHKEGKRFPVLLSVTALRDEDGEINGFLGIGFDITEKVLVERALKEEEMRYRLLFEKSGDSIFLMKGDQFIDCNPATLEIFRCTRDQIINETPYRFSPRYQPDGRRSRDKALEKINNALAGETQIFDWQHLHYDGSPFDAEVTLNVVTIHDEPHLLATVRDISDRKATERELNKSRKQLIMQNMNLRLINHLSNRLHGHHSFHGIANETLAALLDMTKTRHIAFYLISEDMTELNLVASHGFDEKTREAGKTLPLKNSLSGYALDNGYVVIARDIATDDRLERNMKEILLANNIHSAVVLPLIYRGQKLGCINMVYEKTIELSDVEKETLDVITNTVSQSLTNALQFRELEYIAHHDSLTGLTNRLQFHQIFERNIEQATDKKAALLLLDLDRFKELNDTLGHHVGDDLLKQIGARLSLPFENNEILLSRLGGDEFTVLIENIIDKHQVINLSTSLLDVLREPFSVNAIQLEIDASIGIAIYPEDGTTSHEVLRSADVAMYEAKRRGGGIMLYNPEFDKHTPERLALIADLNRSIRHRQLVLHFQPKINLETDQVCGFEALVRWQHPDFGILYPEKFIELAELSDAIHHLTREVLHLAVEQHKQWSEMGHQLPIAVNLSARNLIDDRVVKYIRDLIKLYSINPAMLELEITETAIMHDPELALQLLNQLADLGVKLTIDDFGTGYSSLAYLRKMPIEALKIDSVFVKDMLINEQDAIIVSSTIILAHNLNLKVVAEGVEDEKTMKRLKKMGCDIVQGFFISEPGQAIEISSKYFN